MHLCSYAWVIILQPKPGSSILARLLVSKLTTLLVNKTFKKLKYALCKNTTSFAEILKHFAYPNAATSNASMATTDTEGSVKSLPVDSYRWTKNCVEAQAGKSLKFAYDLGIYFAWCSLYIIHIKIFPINSQIKIFEKK